MKTYHGLLRKIIDDVFWHAAHGAGDKYILQCREGDSGKYIRRTCVGSLRCLPQNGPRWLLCASQGGPARLEYDTTPLPPCCPCND